MRPIWGCSPASHSAVQRSWTSGVGTDFACGHEGPMAVRTRATASGIVIVLSEEVGEIATDANGMAVV